MSCRTKCDVCERVHSFATPDDKPSACEECFNSLSHLSVETGEVDSHRGRHESGRRLTLTCAKTGKCIEVGTAQRVVLGRHHVGRDVFSAVPQISRAHCVIELAADGEFLVSDLGSTNKTFVGPFMVDCRENPCQPLRDGEMLYLGREPFQIRLDPCSAPPAPAQPSESGAAAEITERPLVRVCTNCGSNLIGDAQVCEVCSSVQNEF